jgi:23S rRNA (cytosine1962-C5)-methyltransferase
MGATGEPIGTDGRFSLLVTDGFEDYRLLDMGYGRKLEQFGRFVVDRPEEQAMGPATLPAETWLKADAVFDGDAEDGEGRWRFFGKNVPDAYTVRYRDLPFRARFTPFRHMGFFPEQAAHWAWMADRLARLGRPARVLNLFGYTGIASLIAAAAGAHVTHVDASKKSIGFARENQALAHLEEKPIRWIVDDAVRFVEREARRGKTYDAIILDPPKFGRGPEGETWHLFEDLAKHLGDCATLLAEDADHLLLTVYAIRASFLSVDDLMRRTMAGRGGVVTSGEVALRVHGEERLLSTSLFARWSRT